MEKVKKNEKDSNFYSGLYLVTRYITYLIAMKIIYFI